MRKNKFDSKPNQRNFIKGQFKPTTKNFAPKAKQAVDGGFAKYKTSKCKYIAQHGVCHKSEGCKFAHNHEELYAHLEAAGELYKINKNCKSYFASKVCEYGAKCLYQHEHRKFAEIHRYHYVSMLLITEFMNKGHTEYSDILSETE